MKLSQTVKSLRASVERHSPEILTGIGIAGMITTTVIAVRATPKALLLIEEKKKEKETDCLTPLEVVQTTWLCYIPAVITGSISTACLICASSVNLRRNAALATAYKLSESALSEYKEKVIETIGEKKEQSIRDGIAKDQVDRNPVSSSEVFITEKGNTLCYDPISGRYFKSDIETLRKIENELNRQMRDDMYVSLNDFYFEIGLKGTASGHDLGWNIDRGYIDLYFSAQLAEDDTPCVVIEHRMPPKYDFRNY